MKIEIIELKWLFADKKEVLEAACREVVVIFRFLVELEPLSRLLLQTDPYVQ